MSYLLSGTLYLMLLAVYEMNYRIVLWRGVPLKQIMFLPQKQWYYCKIVSLTCQFLGILEFGLNILNILWHQPRYLIHYLSSAINGLVCFSCVFQDPSVTQHSSNTGYATLDLYNPFDNNTTAVNMSFLTIVRLEQAVFT